MTGNNQLFIESNARLVELDPNSFDIVYQNYSDLGVLLPRSELSETHRRIGSEIILFTQPGGRNITPEKVNRLSERLSRG